MKRNSKKSGIKFKSCIFKKEIRGKKKTYSSYNLMKRNSKKSRIKYKSIMFKKKNRGKGKKSSKAPKAKKSPRKSSKSPSSGKGNKAPQDCFGRCTDVLSGKSKRNIFSKGCEKVCGILNSDCMSSCETAIETGAVQNFCIDECSA